MTSLKCKYIGELRTEATHLKSGNKIITDAPVDNNGKGEAFSPSDLVCSALASCMFTIMGIVARTEEIQIEGMEADITKIMSSNPRKISEIHISFNWQNPQASDKQIQKLKNAAHTCPVALSIDPNIKQVITFNF